MLAIGCALMSRLKIPLLDEPSPGVMPIIPDRIADIAAEDQRADGRIIPARSPRVQVLPEPIGKVAAFCAWNTTPANPVRKVAPALVADAATLHPGSGLDPASTPGPFAAVPAGSGTAFACNADACRPISSLDASPFLCNLYIAITNYIPQ